MTKTLKKNKFSKFLFVSKKNAMTAAAIRAPATVSNNFSEQRSVKNKSCASQLKQEERTGWLVKNLHM